MKELQNNDQQEIVKKMVNACPLYQPDVRQYKKTDVEKAQFMTLRAKYRDILKANGISKRNVPRDFIQPNL